MRYGAYRGLWRKYRDIRAWREWRRQHRLDMWGRARDLLLPSLVGIEGTYPKVTRNWPAVFTRRPDITRDIVEGR